MDFWRPYYLVSQLQRLLAPPQLSFGLLLGVGNVGQVVEERPAVDAGAVAVVQLLLHPPQRLLHVLSGQVGWQLASQSHGFSLSEETKWCQIGTKPS